MGFLDRPALPLRDVDELRDCGQGDGRAWISRGGAEDQFGRPQIDTNRAEAVPILGLDRPISGQPRFRSSKGLGAKSFYLSRFRDLWANGSPHAPVWHHGR